MSAPTASQMSAPAKSASDSPRSVMRRATHDIHERLHNHELFRDLLTKSITRNAYGSLLARLYGFHRPLEEALLTHAKGRTDLHLEDRCRAHLLIEDLTDLGWSATADLPLAECPANLGVPGRLLGCLYVKEGAMLGGRVMASKLDHLLDNRTAGRRFFTGRESDPGLWRSCCAAIDKTTDTPTLDATVAAAQETFETFERWMTKIQR